jgi:hypothetical protein
MKFMIAAAAALSLAGTAQAQVGKPDLYGSLGYAKKEDSNLEAGQVRLGARFSPYLGVEGEFALGTEPNTITFPSVPPLVLKNQLRHELAVYGVGFYPVTPNFDVLARVGYGNTWLRRTFATPPVVSVNKFDADSLNLGVGAQYLFDGKNGVRIDYLRQNYGKGLKDENGWAVAFTRRF